MSLCAPVFRREVPFQGILIDAALLLVFQTSQTCKDFVVLHVELGVVMVLFLFVIL